MIRRTGAQIIIELLERQGIDTIAGIPGGANLPIYHALSYSRKIRHILARHEQGAGFIAQGMARVSGRPQVCMATSGPGATNIVTALADAKLDSIPIICITGQVAADMIGTDAFQEVDTHGLTLPITKHNVLVRSARQLLDVIPAAFRIAVSGRPGPVLIDVPKNVQNEVITFEHWPEPGHAAPPPAFKPRTVLNAAERINAAQRPLLYIGGGVVHAGAGDTILQLAEKAGIPTTMTLMALGAVPVDHPLALGMLGMHAGRLTHLVLESCDLLIAAGVRFDDRVTGKVQQFCPNAEILHIDIDPCEIGKIKRPRIAIVGDVGRITAALLPLVEENPRRQWLEFIAGLKQQHPLPSSGGRTYPDPQGLIQMIADQVDDEVIIATDVGQHQMWTAQTYPLRRSRQWLTSGGLGTMGFGLPVAIGAALADPKRMVICFSGDGSLMMNIQELATAAAHQVNVKIVLMDNRALGLVQQQQTLFYQGRIFASSFETRIAYSAIAQGFGLKFFDLSGAASTPDTLSQAFAEKGPCLIYAPIDAKAMVLPMVPPGAANHELIETEPEIRPVHDFC